MNKKNLNQSFQQFLALITLFVLVGYFSPVTIHAADVTVTSVTEDNFGQDSLVCYVWGSALLRESPTTKVYTPIFTVRTQSNTCHAPTRHMEQRLRHHIEGIMGRNVYATYGHSNLTLSGAESYREDEIARNRDGRSRQPAKVIITNGFSFNYSD